MPKQTALLIGDLNRFIEKVAVVVTEQVALTLTETTPEDTAHAITNWVPSIGESFEGEAGVYGKSLNSSIQSSGFSTLRGYKLPMGSLYITNNVDYISLLNKGWSAQAPAGFVQLSIITAILSLRGRRFSQ
ncbi:MAG: hypothetical protein COB09_18525 [Thalassobium sp.]|nr:MAG: hypothetical protein COB09_18525 [Thalassobium sp.]